MRRVERCRKEERPVGRRSSKLFFGLADRPGCRMQCVVQRPRAGLPPVECQMGVADHFSDPARLRRGVSQKMVVFVAIHIG